MSKKTSKQTSVFGQLTLGGSKAVDWAKDKMTLIPAMVMIAYAYAFEDEYELPQWLDMQKYVAIIMPQDGDGRAILVHQASLLRELEAVCAEWEKNGAKTVIEHRNQCDIAKIEIDEAPAITFIRRGTGKFAPYGITVAQ